MTTNSQESQLLDGAKQLKVNIESVKEMFISRGISGDAPILKVAENNLKIEYANQVLRGLE